jgi:hypothetical protein
MSLRIAQCIQYDKKRHEDGKTMHDDYVKAVYLYINLNYRFNTLRKALTRDRYPRKKPAYLPDADIQNKLDDTFRQAELAAFRTLHPRARPPKRLLPAWRYDKSHRNNRGRQNGPRVLFVNPRTGYARYGNIQDHNGNNRRRGRSRQHRGPTFEPEDSEPPRAMIVLHPSGGGQAQEDQSEAGAMDTREKHNKRDHNGGYKGDSTNDPVSIPGSPGNDEY